MRRFLRVLMNSAGWSLGIAAGIFLLSGGAAVSDWSGVLTASIRDAFVPHSPAILAEFDLTAPPPPPTDTFSSPVGSGDLSQASIVQQEARILPAAPPPFIRIRITQVAAGVAGAGDEFIELHNPNLKDILLTGWSLRKKSSDGSTASLVSKIVFEGKVIPAGSYFLLVNAGGYLGSVPPDGRWAKSNTITYREYGLVLSDEEGRVVDEVVLPLLAKGEAAVREGESWRVGAPSPRNSFIKE